MTRLLFTVAAMAINVKAKRRAEPTVVVATRLTSTELASLQRLQQQSGLTTADTLRALIERAGEQLDQRHGHAMNLAMT